MLKALVAAWCEDGDILNIQWRPIADRMPGRSGKQCRERWCYCLRPNIKKGGWTLAEDQLIDRLQKEIGNKWKKISEFLPGWTDNDVKNRWHERKKKEAKKHRSIIATTAQEGKLSISHEENKGTKKKHTPVPSRKQAQSSKDIAFPRIEDSIFSRMEMPLIHLNPSAVHANDIFSPSFFPRQLRMTSALALNATEVSLTPFTPAIGLAAVASCHSGPFFKQGMLDCIDGDLEMFGSNSDEHRVKVVGMTPLPYKKFYADVDHESSCTLLGV